MTVGRSIFRGALAVTVSFAAIGSAGAQQKSLYSDLLVQLFQLIKKEHLSSPQETELVDRTLAAARELATDKSAFENCIAGAPARKSRHAHTVTIGVVPICLDLPDADPEKAEAAFAKLVTAMLAATGESGDRYISPAEHAMARMPRAAIGVALRKNDESIVVVSTKTFSPAARAGVKAGDTIIAIDGVPVSALSLETVIEMLRGGAEPLIKLTLANADEDERILIIEREIIENLQPIVVVREDNRLLVSVRTMMPDNVETLLSQEILSHAEGVQLIVLDLRGNTGGLLKSSVAVADAFLSKGVIVKMMERDGIGKVYKADRRSLLPDAEMIVLINQETAAGAEILASALADNGRAHVVGNPTYGKGTIETLFRLDRDRAVILTTQSIIRPNGASISRVGIEPDCAMDPATFDLSTFDGCPTPARPPAE